MKLFAGVVLAVSGVGAILVSIALAGQATLRRVEADVPVNAGARFPGDINANNSPALARDPVHPADLALANRVDTPIYSCALSVSHDNGHSWSPVPVPLVAHEHKCYAPNVAFGADGTLYMIYVTLRGFGNVPDAVWLVSSSDAGHTFSRPRRVLGPLAFQVRLASDPARPRRLYLTWVAAAATGLYRYSSPGNPIEATRSDDGGRHWTPPVRVSSAARLRVVSPVPVVGPGGVLYVLYLDLGGDVLDYDGAHGGFGGPPYPGHFSLVLARSRDAGGSWEDSLVTSSIVPTRRFIVFLAPFPALAVDRRSGRIYVAFEDGRLGDPDVDLWTLAPGARTWSQPVRVNDTPPHDGTAQYLPAVSVAPDGRLDIVYYDRRYDPHNRFSGVSLQFSFDGGKSFSRHVALSDHLFDSQIGDGSGRGMPDLGDRLAIVSANSQALAAWTDTRFGTVLSNKQDIELARARLSGSGSFGNPARDVLRYGGLAALLVGLGLALISSMGAGAAGWRRGSATRATDPR